MSMRHTAACCSPPTLTALSLIERALQGEA